MGTYESQAHIDHEAAKAAESAHWENIATHAQRQQGTAEAWAAGDFNAFQAEQNKALADFDAQHQGRPLTPGQQDERRYLEQVAGLTQEQIDAYAARHTQRHAATAADAQRWARHSSTGETRHPYRRTHSKAEVEVLNMRANARVFGEYVDPRTGNTVVDVGRGSIIDGLKKDRRFGATEADREATATWFEERIQEELDAGAETAQAEVIVTLELFDKLKAKGLQRKLEDGGGVAEIDWNSLLGPYVASGDRFKFAADLGMSEADASEKAQAQYARLGRNRRQFILDNNIMTFGEYDAAREQQRADKAERQARNQKPAEEEESAPAAKQELGEASDFPELPADVLAAVQDVAKAKIKAEKTIQRAPAFLNRRKNKHNTGRDSRLLTLQNAQEDLNDLIDSMEGSDADKLQMKLDSARAVLLLQVASSKNTRLLSKFWSNPGAIRQTLAPMLSRRAKNTAGPVRERAEEQYAQILDEIENHADYATKGNAINAVMYAGTERFRKGNQGVYRGAIKGGAKGAVKPVVAGYEGVRNLVSRRDRVGQALGSIVAQQEEARRRAEAEQNNS